MAGAEAEGGETRVDVDERVVVVGDVQLAAVLVAVGGGVADESSLPLDKC